VLNKDGSRLLRGAGLPFSTILREAAIPVDDPQTDQGNQPD
jgi:hypothetical protein